MSTDRKNHLLTRLLHDDRAILPTRGTVNPPVHHVSTILFDTLSELEQSASTNLPIGHTSYGIHGSTIQQALAQAITTLENGHDTIVTASGLMAATLALSAVLKSGDHLLMTDSVYGPTRRFCDHYLKNQNIEVTYYDPRIGEQISTLFLDSTKAIFLESPGSYTFELQDVPAIASVARSAGIITLIDNSWATPLYFRPLDHGIDISIHAATKYLSGHSDVMLGSITANSENYDRIHDHAMVFGNHAAPDDCYLVLRGLRTLPQRLNAHQIAGYKIAHWLDSREEVDFVIHPGRADHPDHALWKRDFSGASSLFGFVLKPVEKVKLANMLDNMSLFGMGFSWGGYESLLIPGYLSKIRTAKPWQSSGKIMRIHVGLEHLDDLIADLESGFERMK